MDPLIILGLVAVGVFAGIIGAIFGLGGGIIFVPFLTIVFGLSATEAAAISLVGIVASSVGAASLYVERGKTNVRLGLLLEITSALGAIIGALIAGYLADWLLLCVFSAMLLYSAAHMILHKERIVDAPEGGNGLIFSYFDESERRVRKYQVENLRAGMSLCTVAGAISSMTGVGGGVIKVPVMNMVMHVPVKIASATSSYMIGITAFSGALMFFLNGYIILDYAAGIAIGSFIGSLIGVRISGRIGAGSFRKYLSVLLVIVAVLELLKAGGML